MLNLRFVRRQISRSRHQSPGLHSLRGPLHGYPGVPRQFQPQRSFIAFARCPHPACGRSHYPIPRPFPPDFDAAIISLEREKAIEAARIYEFYSVVRKVEEDKSLLAQLKVVEPGYPFYGHVQLASGRPFHGVLTSGRIIVEQSLLDRLHLRVGGSPQGGGSNPDHCRCGNRGT